MSNLKISVIIPNWNGKHWLKICLPSLKKQTFKNFEVIIVDNGSSDDSAKYIEKYFPEFRVLILDKNYGFAGGVNRGIEVSIGEYLVLVNNDMKLDRDFLKYLCLAADKNEVGMVAAKVKQLYKPDLIDSAGDYIDVVGHANNIGRGEKDGKEFNKSREIFLVTGGASLFKRKVLDKVGLLDEDYFAYMEDVDLSLRAQYMGFKAIYEPRAVAYHAHKGTSSKNKGLLEYWQYRNMTMNILKDFPKVVIFHKLNWLKILLVNLKTIQFLAKQGLLMSALKAEGYILWNLPKLLRKRREIQRTIKVSDMYLLSMFQDKKIAFPIVKWRF